MRCARLALFTVIVSVAAGCPSQQGSRQTGGAGGDGSGGTGAASGGTSGAGGVGGVTVGGPSPFPAPPTSGVARPSGTPGNLQVLDWAGFKAAVTYTFDDTNSSQIQHYAELQALGVRMTFYLITGKTEATDPIWMQALTDGHELGNHTKSHAQTGTAEDVDSATDFLQQHFGITVWTMASPYGDASYPPLAATRFLVNRGVSDGLVAPNDSTAPFNLYCFVPPASAAASAFNAEIDAARTAGRWRIVLVHGFIGGTDSAYQPVDIGEFTSSVQHTKSFGDVWIDSMVNVASYWRGQKAFTAAAPATSGSTTTWTWTLPDHFPPGKVLRVKVDGGTLTQAGQTLPWDDHGYYEVALDAGSLTLSP
jgi:peptidoglycan/xylan/chitin deacetylase (PgdA/CDA1 family)